MTLDLHATPEEVMRAVEALQAFASERGVLERDIFALSLALEECASNVVNHGLKRDPTKLFRVRFEHTQNELSIELRDGGPEFDPTVAVPKRAIDEEPLGGWGIDLVRRYSDEIRYRREGGQNVLRLTRRLGQPDSTKPFPSVK